MNASNRLDQSQLKIWFNGGCKRQEYTDSFEWIRGYFDFDTLGVLIIVYLEKITLISQYFFIPCLYLYSYLN